MNSKYDQDSLPLRRGFTLVELLVVMVIIAILGTLMITAGKMVSDHAKVQTTKNTIAILKDALEAYRQFKGYYPLNQSQFTYNTFQAVPECKSIIGKLPESAISGNDFIDAFKGSEGIRRLEYRNNSGTPIIFSNGKDGLPNTADDIVSTEI